MNERTRRAIEAILEREGGFVNISNDRGGPTNMGITLATLIKHRGSPVAVSDVRNLTRDEAVEIYHERYIEGTNIDLLNDEWLFSNAFDMIVNHGASNAVKILQRAVCTVEDGILGPITAEVANRLDPRVLRETLIKERALFYARIVERDPTQSVFIEGWIRRAFEAA
jgi:lysozyme family protein